MSSWRHQAITGSILKDVRFDPSTVQTSIVRRVLAAMVTITMVTNVMVATNINSRQHRFYNKRHTVSGISASFCGLVTDCRVYYRSSSDFKTRCHTHNDSLSNSTQLFDHFTQLVLLLFIHHHGNGNWMVNRYKVINNSLNRAVQWHCTKRAKAHFWAEAPEIIP